MTSTAPHGDPTGQASEDRSSDEPGSVERYPGLFIALEGGDGAGKSTQIKRLTRNLQDTGHTVLTTREPGGSPMGEEIRDLVLNPAYAPVDARTEALLFAASRSAHVETVIRPALQRGEVVVTDRYLDSSVAYQGAGRGLGTAVVRDLNTWAVSGLMPDLTVLLDVSAATGRARRSSRTEDRMEQESEEFHDQVRQAFLDLAAQSPDRYLVLPADSPVPALAERIAAHAQEMLGARRLP